MYERKTPSVSFCIQVFKPSPFGLQKTIQSIDALGIPDYEILVAGSAVYPPRDDISVFDCQKELTEGRFGTVRDTLIFAASNEILIFCTPDIDFRHDFFNNLLGVDTIPSFAAIRILNPDGTRYWDWFVANDREATLIDYEDYHPDICFSESGYIINRQIALSLKIGNIQFSRIESSTQSFIQRALSCGIRTTIVPQLTASHRDTEWTQSGNQVMKRIPPESLPCQVEPGVRIFAAILDEDGVSHIFDKKILILLDEVGLQRPGAISFEIGAVGVQSPHSNIGFKIVISTGEERYFELNKIGSTYKIQVEFPASYVPFQIILEPVGIKKGSDGISLRLSHIVINRTQLASETRGVNWCSHVFDYSGYASLARTLIPLVSDWDIPLDVSPLGGDENFLRELNRQPKEFSNWAAISRRNITQGVGLMFYVPAQPDEGGCYTTYKKNRDYLDYFIGFSMLEVDRIPSSWVSECNEMDEVWVPSQFCADIFESSGVRGEKIQIIPIGVDSARFHPDTDPLIARNGLFRFISVFQWNNRKGWDVLIGAYLRAFLRNDDVELIIRAYPDRLKEPSIKDRLETELSRYGLTLDTAPRIRLIEEFVPDRDMPALYTSADCFVLPSRGEGIGLPYLEAMASGLPVIATAWGGHLDFLTEENSYLVHVQELRPVDLHHRIENPHYRRGMMWAEPSVEHCAELMQTVFENRRRSRDVGRRGLQEVRDNWTLERTSKWMANRFALALDKNSRAYNFHRPELREDKIQEWLLK